MTTFINVSYLLTIYLHTTRCSLGITRTIDCHFRVATLL
jgi:hypothetical protein